jgi:VanZ family protein
VKHALSRRKVLLRWLGWLLWMLLIFWLSSHDKDETTLQSGLLKWVLDLFGIDGSTWMLGPFSLIIRKTAHLTVYAILMGFTLRVFRLYWVGRKLLLYSLLFCMFYAITDEYHQTFVPGRGGSPIDVLIDTLGALVGMAVSRLVGRKG